MDNDVMFKISYGLYVLTAKDGEKHNGCIINTLQQVTTSPNRVTVTVNKANYTHDMIMKTGIFNVSILSEKATFDIFKHFGFQSGKDVNKFDNYPMEISDNGIAYVPEGTNGFISGNVIQKIDLGTHTMFVADVTDGRVIADDASATYDYYHKNIKQMPDQKRNKNSDGESGKGGSVWVCQICGYEYEGEQIPEDFVCPWCKHGAADFKKK